MITVYAHARAPDPVDVITWDDAAREIESLCYHEAEGARDKTDLPCIGPYTLRDGCTRSSASVAEMDTSIVLDLDGCDLDAVEARIDLLGLDAIVYGSPSDSPEVRKVRVMVRTDGTHAPDEAGRTRAALADYLGVQMDPSTVDASRIFFAGRLPGTPARHYRRFAGSPLRMADLPSSPPIPAMLPATPPARPVAASSPTPVSTHDPVMESARYGILAALGDASECEGRKHAIVGAVAGVMRSAGWSLRDAQDVIRAWITGHARDVEAGLSWAARSWDRPATTVSGVAALAAIVGRDMACAIEASASLPMRVRRGSALRADVATIAEQRTGDVDGLIFGDLSPSPPRRVFLVPELEIGVGRAYGWLGKSNASKTLAWMQLEVDLAMGRAIWGRFRGPGSAVPVLRIAYEGFSKCAEDYARIVRATRVSVDWRDLGTRLRFAEGRRFLTEDRAANVEWLLRVAEPYQGGLVTIDPLIAACCGLDENTSGIADPIYDCEHVSARTGAAFAIVHHMGHAARDRSRGHSAIEGAFGANASIEKSERDPNLRHVTPRKMDRYGTGDFDLRIYDTDERGTAWVPTRDTRSAGEVSWGVSVEYIDSDGRGHGAKADQRAMTVAAKATMIVEYLRREDFSERSMTVAEARGYCHASGDTWPDIYSAVLRAGIREERRGRAIVITATGGRPA